VPYLLAYFIAYSLHRFTSTPTVNAVTQTGILLVMLWLCWRLGGWTSPSSAWRWLLVNKQSGVPVAVPVLAGSLVALGLWLYSEKYSPIVSILEALWLYFFFHAFAAVWSALMHTLHGHDDAA